MESNSNAYAPTIQSFPPIQGEGSLPLMRLKSLFFAERSIRVG